MLCYILLFASPNYPVYFTFFWLFMTVLLLCYALNLNHTYVTCPDWVSSSLPPLPNAFIHLLQSTLSGVKAPTNLWPNYNDSLFPQPWSGAPTSFVAASPPTPNCMPGRLSTVSCRIPTKSTMKNSSDFYILAG